jgi:hypothetical protein
MAVDKPLTPFSLDDEADMDELEEAELEIEIVNPGCGDHRGRRWRRDHRLFR